MTVTARLPPANTPPPFTPLSLLGDLTLPPPYHLPRLLHSRQTARSASLTDGEPGAPFTLSRVYHRRFLPRKSSSRLTDGGTTSTCLCARRSLLPTACLLLFPG